MYISIWFLLGIAIICAIYFIVYYIKNSRYSPDFFREHQNFGDKYGHEPQLDIINTIDIAM